jgi:muramoyltetrapeptide carboxypeptidase LdcA involved in peptidoglycan recycling
MLKPRRLRSGDKVAVVAPASGFPREEFDKGVAEIRRLGFEPVFEESVFDRAEYVAGAARVRADAFLHAWRDPSIPRAHRRPGRLRQRASPALLEER